MTRLDEFHSMIEKRLGARVFKLLRYLISGGTAAMVNFATLFVLVHFFSFHYLSGSVVAFITSVVVSFTLQKFWTFRDKLIHDIHMQFSRYVVVISSSLLINTLLVYVMVEKLHMWYMFAQILATVIIATINFFAYRHFVFEERGLPVHTNLSS